MTFAPGSVQIRGVDYFITQCTCGRRFVLASAAELRNGTALSCGPGCDGRHAEVVELR